MCLECVGSPFLCVVEGEGMLLMRHYPEEAREALARAGDAAGVPLRRGLKTVGATDGLIALRAGYRVSTLGAVDETKFPSNYHWPSDVPDNLTWESVEGAAAVCEAYVRAATSPRGTAPSAARPRGPRAGAPSPGRAWGGTPAPRWRPAPGSGRASVVAASTSGDTPSTAPRRISSCV